MFHSNKLFAFTLLALVATASARPVDLLASQDPSTVTHSLNSTPTESIVPVTSTLIVDSSLSAPTQLTDHKAISTMPAPVLPVTPSVTTATTLPTGTPAVPSTPVDPRASIVHSDVVPSAAPQGAYCLVDCHLVLQGPSPSPVDVPEHTMTSSIIASIPTPTTTDLHATEPLPSAMSSSPSALPTTTVATGLGAQTPAARVAETSAASVVETSALATPATTTLPTSANAPSVSGPAVNPPCSGGVPASASSLPASVPVSAPSPPAMSPAVPTDAVPPAPAVPTSSTSS
ncbi:hypothetical protein C8Q80DRAFT_1273246 [Daedaleopsis nitida]|nr:hypothetical protein C8Q80DRAFT_1273246 [Daedaleopsis nitida]